MVLDNPDVIRERNGSGKIEYRDDGYHDKSYSSCLLASMERIRASGSLYDVTLLCCGKSFGAHRIILASASNYFLAMFTGGMKEANMPVVELKDVDVHALDSLLKYTYSGVMDLNESNIQSILETADRLDFHSAFDLCIDFLIDHLEPLNCIGIFQLAEKLAHPNLKSCARLVIEKNFTLVCKLDTCLQLDLHCFLDIISSDHIAVCSETEVLDAIVDWISYSELQRVDMIEKLVLAVRPYYLGPKTLEDYIEKLHETHPSLVSPLTAELLFSDSFSSLLPMRKSYEEFLHVLGGETSFLNEIKGIEYWDNGCDNWVKSKPLRVAKSSFAAVYYDDKLFVIGGMKGSSKLNTVEFFDCKMCSWVTLPHLSKCKGDVSTAVVDDSLYVAGGSSERASVCRYVEKFDAATRTWQVVGKMNCRRRKFCLVSYGQHLYAFGGMNDREGGLNSVESKDNDSSYWESKTPMATCRYDFGAAVLSGYVYVVGGASESMGSMNLVEKYNPVTDTWTSCSAMLNCRGGLSVAVHCGRILAISGIDSYMRVMNSMESYDETTDEWSVIADNCIGRSGLASVILPFKLPS